MKSTNNLRYKTIVITQDQTYEMAYSYRDLGIIMDSPQLEQQGVSYAVTFGVYEHFKVRKGLDKKNITYKNTTDLLQCTEAILQMLEEDQDVLGYDYLYSFPEYEQGMGSGGCTIKVYGTMCSLNTKPKGQCYLEKIKDHTFIDLRRLKNVETDHKGIMKIHRRKKDIEFDLLKRFRDFVEFLRSIEDEEVAIRHIE